MTFKDPFTIPVPVHWQDHVSDFLLSVGYPEVVKEGEYQEFAAYSTEEHVSLNPQTGGVSPFQCWYRPFHIIYAPIPAYVRIYNQGKLEENYAVLMCTASQFLAYGTPISEPPYYFRPPLLEYRLSQHEFHPKTFHEDLRSLSAEGKFRFKYVRLSLHDRIQRFFDFFRLDSLPPRTVREITLPAYPSPFEAIIREGPGRVEAFLSTDADIDRQIENGQTALQMAVRHNQGKVVRLLLDRHADVNASSESGWTALMSAAMVGSEELLLLLLEKGASVDAHAVTCQTALRVAVVHGHDACVRLLIEQGATLDPVEDNIHYTTLMFACTACSPETVALLIEKGADVNVMALDRMTPLRCAEAAGRKDLVALLKRHGTTI